MKNLLLLLLLLPFLIKAESEWTSTLPIRQKISILDSEIRYKWYKEEKYNLSFVKKDECNCEYLNLNEYKLEDIDVSNIIDINDIDVVEESITKKFDVDQFKYILFSNFDSESNKMIKEITIYDQINKRIIEYEIKDYKNIDGNINEINDGMNYNGITINNNSQILLYFNSEYNSNNIKINLYVNNNPPADYKFNINFMLEKDYIIKSEEFVTEYYCPSSSYCLTEIIPNANWNTQNTFIVSNYKQKIYECYDIKKIYLDDYHLNMNNHYKDEEKFKIFYKYEDVKNVTYTENTISLLTKDDTSSIVNNPLINSGVINDQISLNDNVKVKKEKNNCIIFMIFFVVLNIIFGLICFVCRKIKEIRE